MTARSIPASRHEANSLHEGRATAIARRMEPQPIDLGDRWEWRPKGAEEISRGLWVPSLTWRHDRNPAETGAMGIVDFCPHGRVGDVISIDGRDYVIASIDVIRVAEMTEEQAKACGRRGEEGPDCYSTALYQFRHDYESLHGEGSWLRDHVWLIGLKGVEA